jgi:DUF1009 family protein
MNENRQTLGIIAGNGMMPVETIWHCRQNNIPICVVGLEQFCIQEEISKAPHIFVKLGEIGKMFNAFKQNNVKEIIFAGGLIRPSFKDLIPDWEGVKIVTKLAMKRMTDDNIFRFLINEIESRGFKIIGTQDIVPALLFQEKVYTKVKPSKSDLSDIQRGWTVAKAIGAVDVGQAVVVQNGLILAMEAIEGTNLMLSRASELRRGKKKLIMVKVVKPGQDMRVDLPAIGLQTMESFIKYGIGGIAVEAGGSLFLEKETVIKKADENGIFIVGVQK